MMGGGWSRWKRSSVFIIAELNRNDVSARLPISHTVVKPSSHEWDDAVRNILEMRGDALAPVLR